MKRIIVATLFAVSCSHTRPAEMTAVEHRAEARVHQENARRQDDRYITGLRVEIPLDPAYGPATAVNDDPRWRYNPTVGHLYAADREMSRASAHLAAARKLETFEANACRDIPPAERSACPLLASSVSEVHDTKTGIELQLKPEVDATDTHRRLACHLAYAEANGFERPSCPLFVKGIKISLHEHSVLVFTGENPAIAEQLQDQARRVFAPEVARPPAVSHNP